MREMEQLAIRPGVVLTEICGEHLLLAAKAAREHCPYMTQISESSAFLWDRLVDGASLEDLERAVIQEYEIENPAEAREEIQKFVDQMQQLGYLLREGEKNE